MKKVSSEIEIVIYWLVDVFGLFGELFLRIFVYCNFILDVFKLYNYVVKEFENCINLVEMFYLEIFEDKKEKILLVLWNKDSCVWIVIVILVFGMGVDVLNCNLVVLYGFLWLVVDFV